MTAAISTSGETTTTNTKRPPPRRPRSCGSWPNAWPNCATEALAQLATAEQQARIGDENGVTAHLKKAGPWALTMAEILAMSAAETAIRTSLGG
ncbi:hypothetical protein [Amycolatopsis coloradensis]|uniref:hypothetical protein n=1 Tax=Amycolatopsis coloradensis TaxID=76021 RepID=UPI0011781551|nr:hypothetical protein [Amycolatopsis coloradensis]